MCLDYVNPVGSNRQKGFAYKVVNPHPLLPVDHFTGKWANFRRGGGGTSDSRHTVRNCVVWKIGRMYRVKHNRTTEAFERNQMYPAWVHLYKRAETTRSKWGYGEVVLVCWYTSGKYEDGKTIVAKRVTPLLVLRSVQQLLDFENLKKHYGWKLAIKKFQEGQCLHA